MLLLCCGIIDSSNGLSSPSSTTERVAVIGASGRLGREAVQILSKKNIPCTILLRQQPDSSMETNVPSSIDNNSSREEVIAFLTNLPNIDRIVVGDVTSPETCKDLLRDCTACLALYGATRRSKISDLWTKDVSDTDLSHAKQVNYHGVLNLIQAAKEESSCCKRIVRITGKGETPTSFVSILINILGSMAKAWNYQGELALREKLQQDKNNDVEYTIIRPGLMTKDGPKEESILSIADNGGDLSVTAVKYHDIATVCCESLNYPQTAQSTLTVMTKTMASKSSSSDDKNSDAESTPEQQLSTLLENVKPDTRHFPTDMLEQHQRAVRNTIKCIFGIGALILLAILRALL